MKLEHVLEGLMKRSDRYVSGEDEQPVRRLVKKTPFQARLSSLAKQAGVSEDKVRDIWVRISGQVDSRNMNRWAIITSKVKQELGI